MLGERKVKKWLNDGPTELQNKINKIVNTDYIDPEFSHTLQHHMKQEKTKEILRPSDIFEGMGKKEKIVTDKDKENKAKKKVRKNIKNIR
mgnify:CR=1 FL=1